MIMCTFIKAIAAAVFLFMFASDPAHALAISASDQQTSCNLFFPCGLPALGPGQADDLSGESLVQKSAIEFSLAGLTEISNANLRLVATALSSYPEVFVNDPVLEIHGYSGDGIVQLADLDVNNLLLTSQPITSLGVYTFDVTSYVAALVTGGAAYAGFAVRDTMPNSAVTFFSSNTLVVNVPEPGQIWLMVGGLVVILIRLRRQSYAQPAVSG
jgi:hypothetical protein